MKSRISCFEKTTFKKDVTRFAPLWAIYLIVGILIVMSMLTDYSAGAAAQKLARMVGVFSTINLVYACVVAQLLFGDLFQSRMCNAIHAMPLSRGQLFGSHVAAGLCYSLVPHIIGALIMATRLGEFWFVAFIWLLGMTLEYLFFFGVAVFSIFCTGNRFAMVAVYGILNFFSLIGYWFIYTVYAPVMRGVVISDNVFYTLCPVANLCRREEWIIMDWVDVNRYTYEGLGGGWDYLGIIAVIGVVLVALSWLLYRRRQLECAGDFIAVRPLEPVFAVVFTLCVGAVFALFGDLIGSGYVLFLIIGMVLGWFVAQMLLQRTVKVFRPKAFGKLAILVAVMIASLLLVRADLFGVVRYIPDADRVTSVTISRSSRFPEYNDSTVKLKNREDIETVVGIHEYLLEQEEDLDGVYYAFPLAIRYELDNGRAVVRYYDGAALDARLMEELKAIYSRPTVLFGCDTWEEARQRISFVVLGAEEYSADIVTGLLDAIGKDVAAGGLSQNWFVQNGKDWKYSFTLILSDTSSNPKWHNLYVYPEAENTIAWLDDFYEQRAQQQSDRTDGIE